MRWIIAIGGAALAAGAVASRQPLLLGGVAAAVVVVALAARSPRAAFVIWLLSIMTVPYWVGAQVSGYLPVATLAGALVLVPFLRGVAQVWLNRVDVALLAFVLGATALTVVGLSPRGTWLVLLDQWALGYVLGRVFAERLDREWLYRALAVAGGVLGALAVAELLADWHPFVGLYFPNSSYTTWSPIQYRGGQARSEWAFGHSIALAGVLAATVPFIVRAHLRSLTRAGLLLGVFGGLAATGSRGGLLAAVLSLALSLLFLRKLRMGVRLAVGAVAGAVGVFASSSLFEITLSATAETESSTGYRVSLFERLLPDLHMIGPAAGTRLLSDGNLRYRSFTSIDNAFLNLAMQYGWLLTLLLIGLLVVAAFRVTRRGEPAVIAVVGQVPLLLTVSMITQYQVFFWAVAGVAAAATAAMRQPPTPTDREGQEVARASS